MVTCVFCKSSEEVVLAGKRYNKKGEIQRLKCNLCKRRFTFAEVTFDAVAKPLIPIAYRLFGAIKTNPA